jgi:hypothetical protein
MRNAAIISLLKRVIELLRKRPVEKDSTLLVLTVWQRGLLSPDWPELADGFDAVSVKCVDGSKPYRMGEAKETAKETLAAGMKLHAWGFHYCLTDIQARNEAEVAAKACIELGAEAYHWNAEKQWAATGDPASCAIAFAQEFKSFAPAVQLYANCFNDPITSKMMENFDFFEPMCYGTKRKTISKKIDARMGRHEIPTAKKAFMVGTGRKEAGKPGRAWGYLSGEGDTPGLAQLAVKHRPAAINFFRAGKANGEDIMVEANDVNPSLGDQARQIRAALDGAVV